MKNSTLFIIFFIFTNISFSQKNYDNSKYFLNENIIYTDIFTQPVINNDSIDVFFLVKYPYSGLVLKSINKDLQQAIFEAEIIIQNEEDIVKSRIYWKDTIKITNTSTNFNKMEFVEGFFYKRLKLDNYKATTQIFTSSSLDNVKSEFFFNLTTYNKKSNIYRPIMGTVDENNLFKPYILDTIIPFGSTNTRVYFYANNQQNIEYNYSFNIINESNIKFDGAIKSKTGKALIYDGQYLIPNQVFKSNMWNLSAQKPAEFPENVSLYYIEFPSEYLAPGRYKLELSSNDKLNNILVYFTVKWMDMPKSLQDLDYAVNLMHNILTDQEFNELKTGNDNEIIKKLSDIWNKKDPTPSTPFNEALFQYYSRVDYAYYNFQTLQEKDGAKTARGIIYILKGKPDDINSNMENNISTEIWTYNKLNKKYIFQIGSTGIFELIKIE